MRGKRHIEVKPVKRALRAETRRRDVPAKRARVRRISAVPETPPPAWSLGARPTASALQAVARAREIFGEGAAADAVLGWLFAAFPAFGAQGSDMVEHHRLLSAESYYTRWVQLCTALRLFARDP